MTAPRHPDGQPRPLAPHPERRLDIMIGTAAILAVLAVLVGVSAATRSIPVAGTLLVAALFAWYWAPTVTAYRRHVPNAESILMINLLLGWTLVGWAVAMVMAVRKLPCHASMSNSNPPAHTTTNVRVRTVRYARVTTVAHYKTVDRQRSGTADAHGRGSIAYNVSGATPGYRVNVSVAVKSGTREGRCSTSFTPQGRESRTGLPCQAAVRHPPLSRH